MGERGVGRGRAPGRRRRSRPPPGAGAGRTATRTPAFESLRWIITTRSRPIRDATASTRASTPSAVPIATPAPQRCAVSRQSPTRPGATPRAAIASRIRASSSTDVPRPSPPPAEFSRTSVAASGPAGRLREYARNAVCDPGDPRLDARPPVRADVDVDEPGAVRRRHRQLSREHGERPLEEVVVGPREVDEVRRVDGERPEPQLCDLRPECRQLVGELGPATPGCRVVGEELEAVGTDLSGALGCSDHPRAHGEVCPEPAPAGKAVSGSAAAGDPDGRASLGGRRRGRCRSRVGIGRIVRSPCGAARTPMRNALASGCSGRSRPRGRYQVLPARLSASGAPCSRCTRRRRSARSGRSRRHCAGRGR